MNRYIIRKQRIAPGYLTRVEILAEIETSMPEDSMHIISDLIRALTPGEQLIIHNAGDS